MTPLGRAWLARDKPPRLARLLLAWLLPEPERALVLGDLDEEFCRHVLPARGPAGARLWYWQQVLGSVPYALRLRWIPCVARLPADVRYAVRLWRRHPAFAGAAIATQAIGIAVATAVFAVAYAVLLRPLPYPEPHRLFQIFEGATGRGLLSYQDFVDLRRANRAFEEVAGFSGGSRTLAVPGGPSERVASIAVTDGFFDVLGVEPLFGRTFTAEDVRRGAPAVVILSHGEWQARFGGDPGAIGRTLTLNGEPHTIIGVLPRNFAFPLRGQAGFWLPERPSPLQEQRGYWHWMDVIGRRKSGVSPVQAEADLQAVAASYVARDPKFHGEAMLRTQPLHDVVVGDLRAPIQALLIGVVLVVLATCATLAGMLLARVPARARELSVRAAIGARRSRLVQQLLTETVVLSLLGGLGGLLLGSALIRTFLSMVPPGQRGLVPNVDAIGIDPVVAAVALLLSLVTGLAFGVVPALRTSGGRASAALRGTRASGAPVESRLRFALVSVQMAVALVLLAGATLLGTSVYRLLQVSPGFDPEGLVTMRLSLPERYRETANEFLQQLLARLEAIPGVSGAAAINQAPLTGMGNTGTLLTVDPPVDVAVRTVTPNYFSVMGIRVVRGRAFSRMDAETSQKVVLVNERLADRLAHEGDPLGHQVRFEFSPGPWEVVGVVGNERFDHLDKPLLPAVYFPSGQDPMGAFTLMVRSSAPSAVPAAARTLMAELDPSLPLFAVRTMEQIADESDAVFVRRAALWVLGLFALTAVLLAAMALYGVLAQAVAERTREIGIRMALGATRGSIFGLVLRGALLAAGLGMLLGAAATAAGSRVLSALLFGVRPVEPFAMAAAAVFLALVAVIACLLPASRAVGVNPADAVRVE